MAESDAFRGSPQLVSFLRYVVDATLRGAADRIKGYTIAVEALGRADDFDPQADPIVRVEAMRLRRALARYYENGGKRDCVVIDLPLGSYVPMFRRASLEAAQPRQAVTPAKPRRQFGFASAAALVLAGAAVYAGLDFWFDFNTPRPPQAIAATRQRETATPVSSIFPLIYVGAFQAIGEAGPTQLVADRVRAKLRDALARFDEIAVISGTPPDDHRAPRDEARAGTYGLTANVEVVGSGLVSVAIRLVDASDGRIVFARAFQHARNDGERSAEEAIVREVAVALAQPYGIIPARERAMQMNSGAGDPRYRCLLDSYEYWRSIRSADEHVAVRDCLERVTTADPALASGFAALAELTLQEHRLGIALRPNDAPPLDRALEAARRAVEVRPGSAFAHQALMNVLFLRGEYTLSIEAGERAVALNPYHPSILGCYGARLLALGEVEKGARYLREAASAGAVRPEWLEFYLFLAAHLLNDDRGASTHMAQMISNKFTLGLLARALTAVQSGKLDLARDSFNRLVELQPRWRGGVERELKRMFPADAVASRLTRDLAQLGGTVGQ